MAGVGRNGFLAIAVVFHLIYIYSIFDIYFVSPIVSGMRPFHAQVEKAPAQRLVLFVGDGLRADKAFQSFPDPSRGAGTSPADLEPRPLAPFLRSRVLSHGTFGVSHTRVPTESRPGHVALIAGLYEDVSAVMTGWKLNPVNFDSVFNRSRHTWSWGSPDILPMFKEGAVPGRVHADTYGHEYEDFTQDATMLDMWVFEKVKELFKEAGTNETLNNELRQDKNVFFLHLLGLDTTGHAYRPYSQEYLRNIQIVDKGVEEITNLINNFYDDEDTAFVFTADHGMSDWGSHGDGHPDNTRTPLIAWGSGVAKPILTTNGTAPGHDELSSDWNLDQVQRHDVAQADVAALMAYLAGLEFPVNSVGELPLSYLDADAKTKAKAMLANTQGILEMYRVKEERKKATEIRYKPYAPLGDMNGVARVRNITKLINNKRYEKSIQESIELTKLGLDGLRYLQTYDWLFLRALVTTGYLGWIAFALVTVIDLHVLQGTVKVSRTATSTVIFSSLFVGLCSLLLIKRAPWTYYAYAVFPVVFWEQVYARKKALTEGRIALLSHVNTFKDYASLVLKFSFFVGLLEAIVASYFRREIYTICYLIAIAWPAFYGKDFIRQNKLLVGTWSLACFAMSGFTLLPAIKVESLSLVMIGGALMTVGGITYLLFEKSIITQSLPPKKDVSFETGIISRSVLGAQVGLTVLAMFVTHSSITSLQGKRGLPLGTQVVGWLALVASFVVPFLHSLQPNSSYLHRLMVIFLAFSPIFIILTISYEGLFYVCFFTLLVTWVRLEHRVSNYSHRKAGPDPSTNGVEHVGHAPAVAEKRLQSKKVAEYRALTLADARIALFFLFLLQSAFFSTGNIASVSSFSLDAVYRLIPVFDPFSQGALLLLKIMIPFAVISANLGILNRRLGVAPSALFMVVMAISDVLTLNFFYMVRDEGSWLDIGTTISHFFIASLLCVFVAGLEFVSEVLVSGVSFPESEAIHRTNGRLGDAHVNDGTPANRKAKTAQARGST